MLYADLVMNDKEKEFERARDLVEYLAMFFDSKAVSEIKRRREGADLHSVSKEDFEAQIRDKTFLSDGVLKVAESLKNTNLYGNNKKENTVKRRISKNTISKLIED